MKNIDSLQYIGKEVNVIMDRPLGSRHPEFGYKYPVNYGYISDTKADDGDELDAYVLGVNHAVKIFRGRCIAVIERLNDADDKLIVVAPETNMNDEDIRRLTHFQEQYFESHILREYS